MNKTWLIVNINAYRKNITMTAKIISEEVYKNLFKNKENIDNLYKMWNTLKKVSSQVEQTRDCVYYLTTVALSC